MLFRSNGGANYLLTFLPEDIGVIVSSVPQATGIAASNTIPSNPGVDKVMTPITAPDGAGLSESLSCPSGYVCSHGAIDFRKTAVGGASHSGSLR